MNNEFARTVPYNIAGDERIKALSAVMDRILLEIRSKSQLILLLPRLGTLEEKLVDELAWQYHVDFYDDTLPVDKKRNLVRQALDWHCRKGTPGVIIEAVTAIYGNCVLEEWWEYDGEPYHFRVRTTLWTEAGADEQYKKAKSMILDLKNTRSWLDSLMVYYPEIILPVTISHTAAVTGKVEAVQNIWNLADGVEYIYWDGEHCMDGTIDWSGNLYHGAYRTMQHHVQQATGFSSARYILPINYDLSVKSSVKARAQPVTISHTAAAIGWVEEKSSVSVINKQLARSDSAPKQSGTPLRKGDFGGSLCLDGTHDLSGAYTTNTILEHFCCIEKINAAGAAIEGSFERL